VNNKLEKMWEKAVVNIENILKKTQKNAPYIKIIGAYSRLKKKVITFPASTNVLYLR
jgi:hypothetical protein